MSEIRLKTSFVIDTSSTLTQVTQKLANIESGISGLRNSIDGRIVSRRAIGSRLNSAKRDIDELQNNISNLQRFIYQSVNDYRYCENYLGKRAVAITSAQSKNVQSSSFRNGAHDKGKATNKANKKDLKDAYLGMAGFDWMAPIAGSNIYGTLIGAGVTGHVFYRTTKGYEVLRDKRTKTVKITENGRPLERKNPPKGRPRAKYKIYDGAYIQSQMERGNYVKGAEYVSAKAAAVSAAKDKLGWASIGIDVVLDTKENINSGASGSKITGDIMGDVVVGVGTAAAATALTIAILPAAAPVAAIAAVGFGISVGFTYLAEGIKWNLDWDKDGEKDSVKDIVKTGFGKACSTVAGWFKWKK